MLLNTQQTRGAAMLVLMAATVATLCDKVHVMTHTLVYPPPTIDGQAWWVFPCFFMAFSIMVVGYLIFARHLPEKIEREYSRTGGDLSGLVESFLLFVMVYLLSGFASNHPLFLNALFYGTFMIRLSVAKDRLFMAVIGLVLAVGGAFAEGVFAMMGLMDYSRPDFFYVPAWLPGLYLHGAFALREGVRNLIFCKSDRRAPLR